MLRRFYNRPDPSTYDGKKKGPGDKGDDQGKVFSDVHNCFMIFGGQMVNLSVRRRKQERWEVFSIEATMPQTPRGTRLSST
jgi:hypothetical protein